MPVLVLELRLAFAIVDPAAVRVSHEEDSVVHVIRDARKMDIIEAAGRLIAEDEVKVPSNHILWGCRSNFSFQRHPFERIGFEDRQLLRAAEWGRLFACFLQNQLAIGDSPGTGTI
jgi:hypothetical protein